ncbi:unnamed protein product [Gordionus sp. m RMFG-2023]
MFSKRVGFWLSEKKSKKLNFAEFHSICSQVGIELVQINLDLDLDKQGPFDLIIHKLTDVIAKADLNETKALLICQKFQTYLNNHPHTLVIDPFDNVRLLLNRFQQYKLIRNALCHMNDIIDTPNFTVLNINKANKKLNQKLLKRYNIRYPFICKPLEAHGSCRSHEMALVFNSRGLYDNSPLLPPCSFVVQSFVNHNALLFKVFVIGELYFVVKRPSLKNFYPGDNATIFFKSNDVSRADACSNLTELDDLIDGDCSNSITNDNLVRRVVQIFRDVLRLSLFGIDIIRDHKTGKCHIIDINAFPGYDGVPDFFKALLKLTLTKLNMKTQNPASSHPYRFPQCASSTNDSLLQQTYHLTKAIQSNHYPNNTYDVRKFEPPLEIISRHEVNNDTCTKTSERYEKNNSTTAAKFIHCYDASRRIHISHLYQTLLPGSNETSIMIDSDMNRKNRDNLDSCARNHHSKKISSFA